MPLLDDDISTSLAARADDADHRLDRRRATRERLCRGGDLRLAVAGHGDSEDVARRLHLPLRTPAQNRPQP